MKIEIQYKVRAEPEDVPVRGNAMAVDPVTNKEIEDRIIARLERGEVWAWCFVVVTATLFVDGVPFLEANDTLGCCSYDDEDDFKNSGYYYEDMKKIARNALKVELSAMVLRGQTAKNVLRRFK